ncbi:hypothetical protein H4219_004674 [Mycoemilia scoparia]|uniref:Fungal lipase-type domain-containing protein n=1 Tax=Mycoemilia scoparia TaxID=417184 RepID=A0A9W7ZQU7_9FUNG|nr:hypothetical protein H4219_004674 [Mycoemilia scoparia]
MKLGFKGKGNEYGRLYIISMLTVALILGLAVQCIEILEEGLDYDMAGPRNVPRDEPLNKRAPLLDFLPFKLFRDKLETRAAPTSTSTLTSASAPNPSPTATPKQSLFEKISRIKPSQRHKLLNLLPFKWYKNEPEPVTPSNTSTATSTPTPSPPTDTEKLSLLGKLLGKSPKQKHKHLNFWPFNLKNSSSKPPLVPISTKKLSLWDRLWGKTPTPIPESSPTHAPSPTYTEIVFADALKSDFINVWDLFVGPEENIKGLYGVEDEKELESEGVNENIIKEEKPLHPSLEVPSNGNEDLSINLWDIFDKQKVEEKEEKDNSFDFFGILRSGAANTFDILETLIKPIPTDPKINETEWIYDDPQMEDFLLYAHYAAAAYQDGDVIKNWTCNHCLLPVIKHTTVHTQWNEFIPPSQGFVATNDLRKEIIIAAKGTENIFQMIMDTEAIMQMIFRKVFGSEGKAHIGYGRGYASSKPHIYRVLPSLIEKYPEYSVVLTGHSLGGAITALCTRELFTVFPEIRGRLKLYTYGEPRVGDFDFATDFNRMGIAAHRLVNNADIVPHYSPQALGYVHHDQEFWMVRNTTLGGVPDKPIVMRECHVNGPEVNFTASEDPNCAIQLNFGSRSLQEHFILNYIYSIKDTYYHRKHNNSHIDS